MDNLRKFRNRFRTTAEYRAYLEQRPWRQGPVLPKAVFNSKVRPANIPNNMFRRMLAHDAAYYREQRTRMTELNKLKLANRIARIPRRPLHKVMFMGYKKEQGSNKWTKTRPYAIRNGFIHVTKNNLNKFPWLSASFAKNLPANLPNANGGGYINIKKWENLAHPQAAAALLKVLKNVRSRNRYEGFWRAMMAPRPKENDPLKRSWKRSPSPNTAARETARAKTNEGYKRMMSELAATRQTTSAMRQANNAERAATSRKRGRTWKREPNGSITVINRKKNLKEFFNLYPSLLTEQNWTVQQAKFSRSLKLAANLGIPSLTGNAIFNANALRAARNELAAYENGVRN
jgi:hypothetical protein